MQTARARRFIVFTVVVAATLLSTSCLTSPDTAVSFETSWRNELAKTSVVGASYAVFDGSSLIQTGAYGWADREAGTHADASTPYLIGSVTKVFTAIAVMQLSDRGLVDIDQPLKRYLPEFSLRDGGESITVRQVLTHHAGLPSDVYRHKFSISPPRFDAVLDHLRRQDACAPPGMIYSYSNLGYALLGLMIERVARMPYETFMERSIFEPLGMVDTSFYSTYAADAGFATPYDSAGTPVEEYPIYDVPAGAIVSTAGDMARFGQALLAGGSPILLNDTTAELFRAQNMDVALDLDDRVGLAFNLTPKARENGTVGEHGGATLFHRAQIYLAPDARPRRRDPLELAFGRGERLEIQRGAPGRHRERTRVRRTPESPPAERGAAHLRG